MNKVKRAAPVALKPLEKGQVWRMADANLHVTDVGKLLVHYKLIKGDTKRATTYLSAIRVIGKYLKKNKAILVQE